MTNAEIARLFKLIAIGLEIDGANPFRIRAYQEAARVVESHPEPMASLAATEGRLESIRGIGKDLAQKLKDIVGTGTTELLDEIVRKYPQEVLALTELPGLGPKRVKVLFDSLGVRNRDDLEQAAKAGKVRGLPKFGQAVEQNVLKALAAMTSVQTAPRMLLAAAWATARALAAHVRQVPGVSHVELAGSFRRRRETVGDLDVLASGGDAGAVMQAFTTHPYVVEVLGRGDTKSSVRIASGLQVDLRLVPPESFGAALLYFTGSKAHNIALRKIAIDKGWSLNEYGLTQGTKVIASRTEQDIYKALGLAWIPPEMREAIGEIELAATGSLPTLVDLHDMRADLHMHTDRSDGVETLETMVRAARERGYEYVAITDHSSALGMTKGLDGARVQQSIAEMEQVRREVPGIEVLHGLEVDILTDGALDLDDASLALLDWVIVSVHSRLDMPEDQATARVLKAISHPAVHAMGHPTGRRIGSREPLRFDTEKVFARAAELGVAMEINGQPDRMDLSDVNARLARSKGVKFVIDTDAHNLPSLDYIEYALFNARRAWLTKDDVLNTMPFASFDTWRRGGRKSGGRGAQAPGAAGSATAPRPAGKGAPAAEPVTSPGRKRAKASKPEATPAQAPAPEPVAAPEPTRKRSRAPRKP